MAIAQSIEEMRERLTKVTGEEFKDLSSDQIKEYYMSWFHGGSGGCACKWVDGNLE